MRRLHVIAVVVCLSALFSLTGCSSDSEPASEASKPAAKQPSLYSGQQALSTMGALASRWRSDAMPVRLESKVNSEGNGQGGKSTVWRAGFISPSSHLLKFFNCSGSRLPDSPAYGVSSDNETPYDASVARMAFPGFLLKIDSDKAYEVAQQHGGSTLVQKNPQQPILYVLLLAPEKNALQWHVVYGTEEKAAGAGIVQATTGAWIGAGK